MRRGPDAELGDREEQTVRGLKIRKTYAFPLAIIAALFLAGCSGDDGDAEDADADTTEISAAPADSDDSEDSTPTTASAPQPEQSVPELTEGTSEDITVGGWVFEFDGVYLLCEGATDTDPPDCEGETLEISNGDVIDPIIFLGEPGSRYSDAEVVVTGDVVDGVLTIG